MNSLRWSRGAPLSFATHLAVSPLASASLARCSRTHAVCAPTARRGSPLMASTPASFDVVTLGDVCLDLVVPVSAMPISAGAHQALTASPRIAPGGACNVAIMASRLGASTAVLDEWPAMIAPSSSSSVGVPPPSPSSARTESMWRAVLRGVLQDEAVDCEGLVVRDESAGGAGGVSVCVILVDPKGRHTFVADNERPTPQLRQAGVEWERACADGLHPAWKRAVCRAKLVTLDGYALDDLSQENLCGAIRALRDQGNNAQLWFDPQSATSHLIKSNKNLIEFILTNSSALFVNEEEFTALARGLGFDLTHDFNSAAQRLFSAFPTLQFCICKQGAKGSTLLAPGAPGLVIPSFPVGDRYKDSTGAGDSLMAGVAAGLFRHGLELREAATLGSAAGAATCLNAGAGDHVGSLAQVVACLRSADNSSSCDAFTGVIAKITES